MEQREWGLLENDDCGQAWHLGITNQAVMISKFGGGFMGDPVYLSHEDFDKIAGDKMFMPFTYQQYNGNFINAISCPAEVINKLIVHKKEFLRGAPPPMTWEEFDRMAEYLQKKAALGVK